ncbi:MAG: C25 family cysteine peptidase, partial [Halobacteriovoraceae bacterium]|nr:C25 family cysteine peptidase [Halobacteriovoraceae bacterium]
MTSSDITINNLDFQSGGSYQLMVEAGKTLTLPNGVSVDHGVLAIRSGGTLEIGNGQTLTVNGGHLFGVGNSDSWPQNENNKAHFTVVGGGSNSWNFNSSSGKIDLRGFKMDRLSASGLVVGGTTNLNSLSSGQFTNLSTNYSSVKAIQLNTSGTIPTIATQIYWTWGAFNSEGTDANDDGVPDAPTPANTESYELVSSSGCNGQTIDFTNWTGDWFESSSTFDVDTKINATSCSINMSSAQSAVSFEYLKSKNYNGAVDVLWSTAIELNHLGFNVYRSNIDGSNFTRVNNFLIMNFNSSGLNRGVYRFTDYDVENGEIYQYFVEDVENDLVTTSLHGPVVGAPESDLPSPGASDGGVNDGSNPDDTDNPTNPGGAIQNPSFKDLGDGAVILSQTSTNIKIKVNLLNFSQSPANWDSNYTKLSASGFGHTSKSRFPETLHRTLLIRVDSFVGSAELENLVVNASNLGPVSLSPVPTYTADNDGILRPSFNPHPDAYASDDLYPLQYVDVESDILSVGSEKFLKVNLFPALFKASTGDLNVASELTMSVSLNDGDWSEPTPNDDYLENPYVVANTLRIFYSDAGLYQVSFQDLVGTHTDAPFKDSPVSAFRLYRKKSELPIHIVDFNSDGLFNGNDKVLFYAPFELSLDDNLDSVVLAQTDVLGLGTPLRMESIDADPEQAEFSSPIGIFKSEHEENIEFFTETSIGDELDHFFSARLFSYTGLDSYTFNHDLPFLNVNDDEYLVKINVHLKANLTWFGADNESNLELYINDMANRVADVDYQGDGRMVVSFEVDPSEFNYPTNTFKLRSSGANVSGDYEFSYIDKISFEVVGDLVANDNYLPEVQVENDFSYQIMNFGGNDLLAFDVTDYKNVKKLENFDVSTNDGGSTFDASLFISSENSDDYLSKVILTKSTEVPQVSSLQLSNGYYESLKDPSSQYDYLIIGVPSLLNASQDLIEHRKSQGYRVREVTLDQIYSEFSQSRVSAQAIKEFLNFTQSSWTKPSPKYVLFLGDATFNPKSFDIESEWDGDDIRDDEKVSLQSGTWPLRIRPGRYWDFGDDHFFVTSESNEIPFIAAGRIPTNNPKEIQEYAQKVISYENGDIAPAIGNNTIPFFSDLDQDNEKFEQRTSELMSLEGWNKNKLNGIQYSHDQLPEPQMKQNLINSFDSGDFLISFFGHGASDQLGDGFFNLTDALSLN